MTKGRKPKKNPFDKAMLPVIVLTVLTLSFLFLLKFFLQNESNHTQYIQTGNTVPSFDLHPFQGKKVRYSDLNNKVVLMNFWASWCGSCIIEMPSIIALRKKYLSKDFDVLFINLDEKPQSVIPSITKKMKIDFTQYVDVDGALTKIFNVHAIPFTVILDNQGKVLYIESGDRNWNSKEVHKKLDGWLSK